MNEIIFDYSRRTILQGDVTLVPVLEFPEDVERVTGEISGSNLVIAHSETGHHHVVPVETVEVFAEDDRKDRLWLDISQPVEISHLREEHRHAPQTLQAGKWMAQRQVMLANAGTVRNKRRLHVD